MSDKDEVDSDNDGWKKDIYKKPAAAGKGGRERYVVHNKDRGGWDVMKKGAERASGHFLTKADAIARATEIVRKRGGGAEDVRVQGPDETIRERQSNSEKKTKGPDPR